MPADTSLIAPCGMNCGVCMAYLREKKHCPGCRGDDANKSVSCLKCIIKNCESLKSNSSAFCYECAQYPCKRLKALDKRYRTKYAMSMLENLGNIKKIGLAAFARNEKKRWRCPTCGGVICVHKGYCLTCNRRLNNLKSCYNNRDMAHNHHHGIEVGAKLRFGVILSLIILAAEIVGGILTNSVALLADAGHVLTDVIALALSLYGVSQAKRPASHKMTFGYHRIGVLIAVVNAATIIAVAAFILYESARRMGEPPEVDSIPMMVVAAAGLAVNVFVALWLRKDSHDNLNVRSAFWHAAGDALASVGVIVGGVIIALTGADIVDPIVGALIGLVIVSAAWGILRDGLRVLLEAAPSHVEVEKMVKALLALAGVKDVHDVHVWSITPEIHAMSGHALIDDQAVSEAASIQKSMEELLRKNFKIGHSTLQLECQTCEAGGVLCSLREGHDECPEHRNGEKKNGKLNREFPRLLDPLF